MKRATQVEVAKLAGVSQATVSHVLSGSSSPRSRVSEEARRRVLDAIEAVGYAVNPMARNLAAGRNRILGVFTYESVFPRDGSNFYHPFLVGMEKEAESLGLDLLLFTSAPTDGGRRRLADAGWNRLAVADGCILIGRATDRNELSWLLERRYPFVFVGRRDALGDQPVPFVGADYVQATAALTKRMLAAGHQRVAFLGDLSGVPSALDRVNGYREVVKAAGQRPLLFDAGAFSPDEAVDILLDHRATGVLVGPQVDVEGIERAVMQRSLRIPDDLSVAVLGDPAEGTIDERWSRFSIPRAEMGAASVRMLQAIVAGEHPEPTELMACSIIDGATIASTRGE